MGFPVDLSARFLHVMVAVLLVGGAMFTRFVLMPAAAELPEDEHTKLKERIGNRWRKLVMLGILVLLVTGFYNYLAVTAPAHKGDGKYHMFMGIKMLLAFVVFFLASALAGRSKGLAFFRRDAGKWLLVLILLSSVVIGLGSLLKIRGNPNAAAAVPAQVESN